VSSSTSRAETWSSRLGIWRDSDAAAVLASGTSWSGAELLARAAGAASVLRSISAPGPVPALLTASPTSFAFMIAGAECARPLAPLGPRLTAAELIPCLIGLEASVLLTEAEFLPVAGEIATVTGAEVVVIEEPATSDDQLELDPDPLSTAFILHTSGTTGVAKAVTYRQDRLALRTRISAGLCGFEPGAVYASASPFHHIGGFGNHAVALASGATLVPLPRFTVESWRALADLGVTHALTVPTMLEMLLDAGVLALPDLEVLQYGASPIHPDTLRRTLAAIPAVRLVNLFSQTEGGPITCLTPEDHRQIAHEGRDDLLRSVGRPAAGVELRIEDPGADGVGEVVARAAHFFAPSADGWLHTGDLGHLDPEGYLFLAGRRGDKIIRGGENIYPVEVERVLEAHSAVREAAVIGIPDQRWGEVVAAVIVAADAEHLPDTELLRAHARSQLAGFKIPTRWAFASSLPRNISGKLLRRELSAADLDD